MSLAPEIASPTTTGQHLSLNGAAWHTTYPALPLCILQVVLDALQPVRPHVGSSYSASEQFVDSRDLYWDINKRIRTR